MTTVDESRSRLHAAGWNVGETATAGAWIVTGTNGENVIIAHGATQAEAWHRAVEQAEAVDAGMNSRLLSRQRTEAARKFRRRSTLLSSPSPSLRALRRFDDLFRGRTRAWRRRTTGRRSRRDSRRVALVPHGRGENGACAVHGPDQGGNAGGGCEQQMPLPWRLNC
jgi:hypothetical protein